MLSPADLLVLKLRVAIGDEDAKRTLIDAIRNQDPNALLVFHKVQEREFDEDPLTDAYEWPEELTEPFRSVTVPASEPLLGLRMWHQAGSKLVAPFLSDQWGMGAREKGVAWKPGVNRSSTVRCPLKAQPSHPRPGCRCGIRAVQSKVVLDTFADAMARAFDTDNPVVWGEVAVWGRVCSYVPGDDWAHTLRAQYARLTGPVQPW